MVIEVRGEASVPLLHAVDMGVPRRVTLQNLSVREATSSSPSIKQEVHWQPSSYRECGRGIYQRSNLWPDTDIDQENSDQRSPRHFKDRGHIKPDAKKEPMNHDTTQRTMPIYPPGFCHQTLSRRRTLNLPAVTE